MEEIDANPFTSSDERWGTRVDADDGGAGSVRVFRVWNQVGEGDGGGRSIVSIRVLLG